MKFALNAIISATLLPSLLFGAAVALQDFSNVVDLGTTFYGSWEATGSAAGSVNPNGQFLQGAGIFNIAGSSAIIPTNADNSKLKFDYATALNIGSNDRLAVTAQILSGNTAGSFTVTLFANGTKTATAVFSTGAFSASAYSTVTATLSFETGFNPAHVDSLTISGAQLGGTAAFDIGFDHIATEPEPAFWTLGLGVAALGWAQWRRRR